MDGVGGSLANQKPDKHPKVNKAELDYINQDQINSVGGKEAARKADAKKIVLGKSSNTNKHGPLRLVNL
jgi:hypothetical protein